MGSIRVILVEDERLLRDTLSEVLALQGDVEIVGEAGDGEQAVRVAVAQQPDVILMDVRMPRMDGIAATRAIREAAPRAAVVALTQCDDDDTLFGMLKAGAVGYLLKTAEVPEVVEAVRAASRGEGALPSALAGRLVAEFARQARVLEDRTAVFADLTRREMEILEALGTGARNREIADSLFLSERTVKNHVSAILAKLHVNSRTEAALIASRYAL
jgi:DNA-binding NarL/FixJ family response regulator